MVKVFTEEWVKLLDVGIQTEFKNFKWEIPPENHLIVTYNIKLNESDTFTYYFHFSADGIKAATDEYNQKIDQKIDPDKKINTNNVSFTQTKDVALGIMSGELNSHIEFLMGKIQINGDVLALEEYSEVLEKLTQVIASVETD